MKKKKEKTYDFLGAWIRLADIQLGKNDRPI